MVDMTEDLDGVGGAFGGGQRADVEVASVCHVNYHMSCHVNIDDMTLLLWISNHYFLPLVFLYRLTVCQ